MRVLLSTHAFAAIFAVGERESLELGGCDPAAESQASLLPTRADKVVVPCLCQSTAPESLNHDSSNPQAPHLSQSLITVMSGDPFEGGQFRI